jgi:hypothetical protein
VIGPVPGPSSTTTPGIVGSTAAPLPARVGARWAAARRWPAARMPRPAGSAVRRARFQARVAHRRVPIPASSLLCDADAGHRDFLEEMRGNDH